MNCDNCSSELILSSLDRLDYLDDNYLIRYVECRNCSTVNVVWYNLFGVVTSYPVSEETANRN
jgi:hypothetical protein